MTHPNADPTPEFTQDEITCLLILSEGAPLVGIGRWKKPCEVLQHRGFATSESNYYSITPAGRVAVESYEQAEAAAFMGVNYMQKPQEE